MAKRIDGKAIAAQIKQELKEQVQQLAKDNIIVTLAVIQVGQDPASCVYVRNKQRTCEELGIHSLSYELEETTSEEKLLSLIQELNAREDVDGILVQLPLPGHINEKDVLNAIDPAKDVDGFHPYNVGALSCGEEGFVPGTPAGIIELLKRSDVVTIHARINAGDPPIIGKEEFGQMKETAYLINTARAVAVDMKELYHALSEHKIMGAAIDVFPTEPVTKDEPLLKLDNITVTNHQGGATVESYVKAPEMVLDMLKQTLE